MDSEAKVDVSVITPYYDEPLWMLKRNIGSVFSQYTDYNYEQLVVIDNPRVQLEIVRYLHSLPYSNIKFFINARNVGLSGARNIALQKAKGEYIMLLDTDDSFAPNKITVQLDHMKANNFDHSYAGYREIHGEGEPCQNSIIPPEFHADYLLSLHNICYCGSNCFKKEIYHKLGGFDEEMKEGAEDLEYWLRIATNGYRSGCIPEVLYYLGVHGENMTAKLVNNGGFSRAYKYIKQKHKHLTFK